MSSDPTFEEAPGAPTSKWRALIATVIASAVFFGLLAYLFSGARSDLAARADSDAAARMAIGLATLVSAAHETSQSAAIQRATAGYAARATNPPAAARVIDLDARRLLASTDAADLSLGAAPRALTKEEKPLYDRGRQLSRTQAPAISGTLASNGARLAIATAPIRQKTDAANRISGSVEVLLAPAQGRDGAGPWLWLGAIALAALSACALIGQRFSQHAGGLALGATAAIFAGGLLLAPPFLSDLAQSDLSALQNHTLSVQSATTEVAQSFGWRLDTASLNRLAPPDAMMQAAALQATSDLRLSIFAAGLLALALAAFVGFGWAARVWGAIKTHRTAYAYLAPAMIGMLVLSIFPFLYGVSLSFTNTTLLNQDLPFAERFVGLQHYGAILGDFEFTTGEGADRTVDYTNFYWTFGMTIAWTVSNVAIGVCVGLALALLLNTKGLKFAGVYRTLLILPWAIPNYITALTWKGIFHPQFGSANQVVQAFGGQPVAWFDSVWPSFLTGVITNGWLSFPFMMVVCLGALQAIDEDMYEAARIDGASPWQRFRYITLPSLMPALLPAIIVSVVWTFNMFNVIYLVSAGQPGGATEILITRAYKVAFEEYQYGYAAAYSVVIFLILLIYSGVQVRMSRATEGAR